MLSTPVRCATSHVLRWHVVVLLHVLTIATARADSYIIPDDYQIVCLERSTGKLVWRTKPDSLPSPRLSLVGDVLVAERREPPEEGKIRRQWFLDARTGEILERRPVLRRETTESVGPLKPLPRNLKRPDGTRYDFSEGSTRHLISVVDGKRTVVKRLEDFPRDLHIFENLAIFTLSRVACGEVYAYDLLHNRLAWEFDASKKMDIPEVGYTGIAVDGERILVSTGQTLFALDGRTGAILWSSALPKQNVRRYDGTWTTIARLDDRLVVGCYEDLFLLNAVDGKVLWSFDCGFFGAPWPTLSGERFYLSVRDDFQGLQRPEFRPLPKWLRTTDAQRPTAVVVSKKRGRVYSMRFASKRDLPAGEEVWSYIRAPPSPRGRNRYTLVLFEEYGNQRVEVDVTVPLSRDGKVNVKYHLHADKVSLLHDGELVVLEPVPRQWPPLRK